jgi:gas vesicle protein
MGTRRKLMRFRNTGRTAMWFLIGIGVGTVVGFLYAPKKGKETRRYITKTAEDAKDYITEASMDLFEKSRGFVEDAGELIEKGVKLAARA